MSLLTIDSDGSAVLLPLGVQSCVMKEEKTKQEEGERHGYGKDEHGFCGAQEACKDLDTLGHRHGGFFRNDKEKPLSFSSPYSGNTR